ncbi:MAG: glycosyltransferase [Mucilaginibacter sp.]
MRRLHLYFRTLPQTDRYIPGDRYLISFLKRIVKKERMSGVRKVFINLCRGLDELKIDYDINLPFKKIQSGEPVVVLGNGEYALNGYDQKNPIIAGIGLMTHPAEWPDLFNEYPVAKYLQHSDWTRNIYARYYGADRCGLWLAGIDTDKWAPSPVSDKKFDFLVYNKIMWDKEKTSNELKTPILKKLDQVGLSYHEITYGQYQESEYYSLLQQSKAMLYLCEHESQGFALCEALSMNVPVLAWDQGFWLDPNRFGWGEEKPVPASSIPFFSESCGMSFKGFEGFESKLHSFLDELKSGYFHPRDYVLENITLKKSAQRMLEIVDEVYK